MRMQSLALIKKALTGDVAAIREVQDTVHGKIKDAAEFEHTYTRMGRVTFTQEEGSEVPLTFDVGSVAKEMH